LTKIVDNSIAQNVLVKQLQRFDLRVYATNNGEEAIAGESVDLIGFISSNRTKSLEWEAHDPGFFSVALFDHRSSIIFREVVFSTNAFPNRHADL
jgi:hypothetical protein